MTMMLSGSPVQLPSPTEGQTITRAFKGKLENASADAAAFLTRIAPDGWVETSRTYAPGSWGCGAFLVALLLAIVLIGILIFVYLLIVKPAGTLVVTYERRVVPAETPKPAPPAEAEGAGGVDAGAAGAS